MEGCKIKKKGWGLSPRCCSVEVRKTRAVVEMHGRLWLRWREGDSREGVFQMLQCWFSASRFLSLSLIFFIALELLVLN